MDWDLKAPLWDLAELDRDADLNRGSVLGGPAGGSARQCPPVSGVDFCSVDLKLGGLGDSGSSFKWKDQPRISTTAAAAAPSSRPSKRQRAPGNDGLTPSCLVDGCRADLSKCREYHRRHKVCEAHSKTPVVVVGGQEQRFCQQCSRFHSLVEFDEVKRSCRKRLDGHNRRRRKPHPGSVNSGIRFSTYSQVFPSAMTELNWAGIITQDDDPSISDRRVPDLIERRNTLFVNSSHSYRRERRQFPFLQESESGLCSISTIGSLVGQAHRITNTTSEVMSGNNKMFSNGLTHAFHSDCALSLLSSPNQTSGIDLSHTMQSADQIRFAQPLVPSMQYDLMQFAHSASEAVLVSNANGADSHSQFIFCVGDGTTQVLPF